MSESKHHFLDTLSIDNDSYHYAVLNKLNHKTTSTVRKRFLIILVNCDTCKTD